MKRVVFVLALLLILTVCLMSEAFALNRPYNDPWKPEGEDHPWGGDEVVVDPPPIYKYEDPGSMTTGYMAIDLMFKFLLLDRLEKFYEKANLDETRTRFHKDITTINEKGIR